MFEKYFNGKKLVCFDFDGLLVDTEPLHHKAYNELLDSLGFPIAFDFPTYCNLAHSEDRLFLKKTIEQIHPHFSHDWNDIRDQKTTLYRKLLIEDTISPMEGVMDLLTLLNEKDIQICIVTNSDRCDVETISSRLPFLKNIPTWITRDDYDNPKPAPDGYLKALKDHGVSKDDAIGLEDTQKGISAIKAAGMHHLLINNSSERETGRHYYSLKDLLN